MRLAVNSAPEGRRRTTSRLLEIRLNKDFMLLRQTRKVRTVLIGAVETVSEGKSELKIFPKQTTEPMAP